MLLPNEFKPAVAALYGVGDDIDDAAVSDVSATARLHTPSTHAVLILAFILFFL